MCGPISKFFGAILCEYYEAFAFIGILYQGKSVDSNCDNRKSDFAALAGWQGKQAECGISYGTAAI